MRTGETGSRRKFLHYTGIAVGALLTRPAVPLSKANITNAAKEGRLLAEPELIEEAAPTGLQPLTVQRGRDAMLYVPKQYSFETPAGFVLCLHGAGGQAHHGMDLLKAQADSTGMILLAPHSKQHTWDFILGGYGPDVSYIDNLLEHVFTKYAIDISKLAVAGFSDGASYALSLGLTNGDLFTHIMAFSPGFIQPTGFNGRPHIYISHGEDDTVLPVACSRRMVPKLHRAGYEVKYHQFPGGHAIPTDIRREATAWFTGAAAAKMS